MSLIGSVSGIPNSLFTRLGGIKDTEAPGSTSAPSTLGGGTTPAGATPKSFSNVFEQIVATVDTKQDEAQSLTRKVLLGQSDQLHQSVIAMQEAGVAFQLMVEVRNKLVDSYQELMRMPV